MICITHLPQIAAFADQHFLIEKGESGGRTHTGVRRMKREERVEEIARMLSGAKLTETQPEACGADAVRRGWRVQKRVATGKLDFRATT